jgi:4-diphosphocytidyl-2-C-methyl-D-erythritol kinase
VGSACYFSPAKVNLFFRVLRKREDGYHDVASLYQTISLGDTLAISLADEDRLTCDDPQLPCDERNLVWKAIRAFREHTGYAFKAHVHLSKKIPMQAGLGGGSSNAATALFACNALFSFCVDEALLATWASAFSSDAPFFFSRGSAYGTGRGEKLLDIPELEPCHFWLAKPKRGLSTPEVYKHCFPDSLLKRDPELFLQRALKCDLETFNDLEISAFSLMPTLVSLKEALLRLGFSRVTMTGSGSALMCFGNVEQPALPSIDFFPVQFISRPLRSWYKSPLSGSSYV